ncbi:N-formylglutamate amidohydrolase [Anaerobacillus sp. MEB173]|uniref:N-formylglutamate amidohydrolase n=1 Tax=Anaerobacillus sp. MEB173 TaxID=3383345 RepID=UPI003F91F225
MCEQKKLPLVISVPHGGLMIPTNLMKKCLLSIEEILLDCDTWSQELYDFQDVVEEYVTTPIARIVVDMNRDKDDLPPRNPDGVVKTRSVVQKQVWNSSEGLTKEEIEVLISDYYKTYHHKLEQASRHPNVRLGIDCHTMLDVGPMPNSTTWEKRPLFCLGNRGNKHAQPDSEPTTAPAELMHKLKGLLEKKFSHYPSVDGSVPLVTFNEPFSGGYITKHHGNKGDIPWIQLEINRRLYLADAKNPMAIIPTADDAMKLRKIRDDLHEVFQQLVKE